MIDLLYGKLIPLMHLQSRDLFGLNELPIGQVLHLHPDTDEAIKWGRFLESRRRSGVCVCVCVCVLYCSCNVM